MSLYQRWMQLPPSQRIFAAAFTGIVAYGGLTITDYFNEQGEIEREAQAQVLKEHQTINQAADKAAEKAAAMLAEKK